MSPAAANSGLGLITIIGAGVILLAALVVLWLLHLRVKAARAGEPPAAQGDHRSPAETTSPADVLAADPVPGPAPAAPGELVPFLLALGSALIESGDSITRIQVTLQTIARAYGATDIEILIFPTALIITVPGGSDQTVAAATTGADLRLDQISAVYTVVDRILHEHITPADGTAELRAAVSRPRRSPGVVTVLGHAIAALGLAMLFSARWTDLALAAGLGLIVGVLRRLARDSSWAVQSFLPVGCAFLVASLTCLAARIFVDTGVVVPIIAPLVMFIPSAVITTAVIELASGQAVSGAARLLSGTMRLVLLAFGIVAGVLLVGLPGLTDVLLLPSRPSSILPWFGPLVFGIGVVLFYSSRFSTLLWILVVLYVAYAGQIIGGLLFGPILSGLVGAFAMTPVARLVATQRLGPPTLVTFLPAFWLLVPGSSALTGLTQILGDSRSDGFNTIFGAGVTFVGIAVGVVLGYAVSGRLIGLVGDIIDVGTAPFRPRGVRKR